jgi:glycine/D-amino acid oxidase-like deaminating enzyme
MGWAHDTRPELGFTDADQDHIEPQFSHDTGIDTLPYEAWMQLAEAVPPIGEFAGVMATTAGYYGSTPDHNPFLGYDPLRPNLLRLVGFSGHGAMFGPFTARVAAAKAEAGHDLAQISLPQGDVDLADFSVRRDLSGHAESMVI